jgi:hypothetical protein
MGRGREHLFVTLLIVAAVMLTVTLLGVEIANVLHALERGLGS